MTEAEWNNSEDPQVMLEFLRRRASARKLRLYAVACFRSVWSLLPYQRSQNAVSVAERYADGVAGQSELDEAKIGASVAKWQAPSRPSGLS